MNPQPWTGTTQKQAPHEPKVVRRRTPRERADLDEEEYQEWRRRMSTAIWGPQ